MGISRASYPRQPVPHMPELEEHRGKWVAVKDGEVVAVANSSKDLAYELKRRGIRRAISQYVPEPSPNLRVGLG